MSPTAEALISELRSISGLENLTLPQLEECTWPVKQRIFLMLLSAVREKERVGHSIAASAVEKISFLQMEHQRTREAELSAYSTPPPKFTAAEEKWRTDVLKAVSEALLEIMGRYYGSGSSSSTTFSPRQLSRSVVSCHKAFSFLCTRINNSRQQQPEWETRRQLRKINERKDSSSSAQPPSSHQFTIQHHGRIHDKPLPRANSKRRFGNKNPLQLQRGEGGGMQVEENSVPPPRCVNRSSVPPQPEVFEKGVEVESSSSNNQHRGLEDIVLGGSSRCDDSLPAAARNVKNENLNLKNENLKLKERVNELQSLYDGLLSLNGQQQQTTAGIRKSKAGMIHSGFLQAQVLQLRRQINLQWIAVDAGVESIQDVKGSLYALQDILKTLCDDISSSSTSSTTFPPDTCQTSGKVKLSWRKIHDEIVRIFCRVEAAERSAGRASSFHIHLPSKAGCYVGCGLSLPRELRLRNLSIADDVGGPAAAIGAKECSAAPAQTSSCLLPNHVNVGAVAALGESLSKSLEALVEVIKGLKDGSLDVGGEEAAQARQLLRSRAGSLFHSFSELLICVGALGMAVPVKGVNARDATVLKARELARGVNPSKESGNACLRSIIHMLMDSQIASKAAIEALGDEVKYWRRMASRRDDALLKLAETLRDIGRNHAMDVNAGCLKAVSLTAANVFSASNYGLLRRGGAGQEIAELLAALECSKDILADAQSTLEMYSNTLVQQVDRAWLDFESSYSACLTAAEYEQ